MKRSGTVLNDYTVQDQRPETFTESRSRYGHAHTSKTKELLYFLKIKNKKIFRNRIFQLIFFLKILQRHGTYHVTHPNMKTFLDKSFLMLILILQIKFYYEFN
jgi:hypothetical protein